MVLSWPRPNCDWDAWTSLPGNTWFHWLCLETSLLQDSWITSQSSESSASHFGTISDQGRYKTISHFELFLSKEETEGVEFFLRLTSSTYRGCLHGTFSPLGDQCFLIKSIRLVYFPFHSFETQYAFPVQPNSNHGQLICDSSTFGPLPLIEMEW